MPPKKAKNCLEFIDVVPRNYYSLTDILRHESIGMTEKEVLLFRREAFEATCKYMKENGFIDFKLFWNENISVLPSEINRFANILKISKIAHLIEAFEHKRFSSNKSKYPSNYISFGIRKNYVKEFFGSKGTIIPEKKQYGNSGNAEYTSKYPRTQLKIVDGEPKIDLVKTPVYVNWRKWCKIKNLPYSIAALQAMELQMERNPVEGLEDIEKMAIVSPVEKLDDYYGVLRQKVTVCLNEDVYKLMKIIINNFNKDPKNLSQKKVSIGSYINDAINLMNSKVDLKYSNPELFRELKRQKKQQQQLVEFEKMQKSKNEMNE